LPNSETGRKPNSETGRKEPRNPLQKALLHKDENNSPTVKREKRKSNSETGDGREARTMRRGSNPKD